MEKLRKIIHIDMDMFYAAVEIRDNPKLANTPIVVGGPRGVVLTANYLARPYGIHSGMPCFKAKEKYPNIVFVKPRRHAYQEASQKIHEIFRRFVEPEKIESVSLDEAYLDVTDHQMRATQIAIQISQMVASELHLTCSAGVSSNKMVAKIASDFKKPSGITVVQPHEVLSFMEPLPLRKIPGIGKVSEEKLKKKGYLTCHQIRQKNLYELVEEFGKRYGKWLFKKVRGIDRGVVGKRGVRKSIGKERTIGNGVHSLDHLKDLLIELNEKVVLSLRKKNLKARTVTLKVKYHYDKQITRSVSFEEAHDTKAKFLDSIFDLLSKTEAGKSNVRLVGVSYSNLQS